MNKKKKDEMKPRIATINLNVAPGDSVELHLNLSAGRAIAKVLRDDKMVAPRSVQYRMEYERPSRPKQIYQLHTENPRKFTVDVDEALKGFDAIWAVDTNTKRLFNETRTVNVTVCSACRLDETAGIVPILAMVFGDIANKPELFAWRHTIELLTILEGYDPKNRYALIVDSEFSEISKMNHRDLPIHSDFYLPENWTLLFATADKRDSFLNKAIIATDAKATFMLEEIAADPANVDAEVLDAVEDENHPLVQLFLIDGDEITPVSSETTE
jgi:hypothetical protein